MIKFYDKNDVVNNGNDVVSVVEPPSGFNVRNICDFH